jgi:hypothetical protein
VDKSVDNVESWSLGVWSLGANVEFAPRSKLMKNEEIVPIYYLILGKGSSGIIMTLSISSTPIIA